MNGVQWIKITTDIFDDEKIQLIESMPEGDTLIVIWFKILVLAGKQNNSGILSLGNKVYYTEEMLSTVFRRKATSIKLALSMFEEFGMIEIIDGAITIPKWEKHQNIDGLEKIRKQTRERVARHRQKQKALITGEPQLVLDCNVTVTDENDNVTQEIKNKSKNKKEIENILDNSSRKTETYIPPKYYSLLESISYKYNDRFLYPNNYTLTHAQKMKIGEYLASGYVTSDEVISMIERIPEDATSPLAYLFKSMENLKHARKMLFKSSPIYLQFDFESYHDFIFQVRRIINNLRQLERIAEQSEDLDNVRIFHYCVELMIEYEKKTSKQVKELVKRLNKKTR